MATLRVETQYIIVAYCRCIQVDTTSIHTSTCVLSRSLLDENSQLGQLQLTVKTGQQRNQCKKTMIKSVSIHLMCLHI